jgi:phosphopantothenoylcysteine synthetase/decarboxylase
MGYYANQTHMMGNFCEHTAVVKASNDDYPNSLLRMMNVLVVCFTISIIFTVVSMQLLTKESDILCVSNESDEGDDEESDDEESDDEESDDEADDDEADDEESSYEPSESDDW